MLFLQEVCILLCGRSLTLFFLRIAFSVKDMPVHVRVFYFIHSQQRVSIEWYCLHVWQCCIRIDIMYHVALCLGCACGLSATVQSMSLSCHEAHCLDIIFTVHRDVLVAKVIVVALLPIHTLTSKHFFKHSLISKHFFKHRYLHYSQFE